MILDKLMHLLHQRSYDLQVLTLRVFWENEYTKTVNWVRGKAQELETFIRSQARWRDDMDQRSLHAKKESTMDERYIYLTNSKTTVIDKLLEFEMNISNFDQGQFTTTVNIFQEMDDTSRIELPSFLESRQVEVEEAFEALVNRTAFARQVVEQYLAMADFMETSDHLIHDYGENVREKLIRQTSMVYKLFLDQQQQQRNNSDGINEDISSILNDRILMDENANFQEQAVGLITDTASRIPFTETSFTLGQQENQAGNDRVRLAVKSQTSNLILFGESLEHKLRNYRLAIHWYSQVNLVYTDLCNIRDEIDNDIHIISRFVDKLELTYGEQVERLSGTMSQDETIIQERHLQQYVEKIDVLQTQLDTVANKIQEIYTLHEIPPASPAIISSSTLPCDDASDTTTICSPRPTSIIGTPSLMISDTISYLETTADTSSSQLQKLAHTLDQWKYSLSMMKRRQDWEDQYNMAIQWIAIQEEKCQHMRMESAWSPTENLATQDHQFEHTRSSALSLEQEWTDFKSQQLCQLKNTFAQLISGSEEASVTSGQRRKWILQQDRQDTLLSKIVTVDAIFMMVMLLLEQRKAITTFLINSDKIQSQGARWLYDLKAFVLQSRTEQALGTTETLPQSENNRFCLHSYSSEVEDLWATWKNYDSEGFTTAVKNYRDINAGLTTDLDQLDTLVKEQALEQYNRLTSLGSLLAEWGSAADHTMELQSRVQAWSSKTHSLDNHVVDLFATLVTKKDNLVAILEVDSTENKNKDTAMCDFFLDGSKRHINDIDGMVQHWLEKDFNSLHQEGLDLQNGIIQLVNKLECLMDDQGDNKLAITVDMETTLTLIDNSQDRCTNMAQSLLPYVLKLIETNRQRSAWEIISSDLSLKFNHLQEQLEHMELEKQNCWRHFNTTTTLQPFVSVSTTLQDLIAKVAVFREHFGNQFIISLHAENDAYCNMEQSYHDLSQYEFPEIVDTPSRMMLPISLQKNHAHWGQVIPFMEKRLESLATDLVWLSTGDSWLQHADEQVEIWMTLLDDLEHFVEQDAKWTITLDKSVKPSVDTLTVATDVNDDHFVEVDLGMNDLRERVDDSINKTETILDEMNIWKSDQPLQEQQQCNGIILDEIKIWDQKKTSLEQYRADVQSYLKYASAMIDHRNKLGQWLDDISELEQLGETIKATILQDKNGIGKDNHTEHSTTINDDDDDDDDDDTIQLLLVQFDKRLSSILDYAQNVDYPVRPSLSIQNSQENTDITDDDDDDNMTIRQFVQSRHEQIKDLLLSLHSIWNAKERSARLKALVDGHAVKVLETETWIKDTNDKLRQATIDDDGKEDVDIQLLESKLDVVIELEKAANVYAGIYYSGLKESAHQCITAIRSDIDNNKNNDDDTEQLDRISIIQKQVDIQWQQLLDSLTQQHFDLQGQLQEAERAYWKTQFIHKCQAMEQQLTTSNSNLDTIEDHHLDQWKTTINNIKSVELDRYEKALVSDAGDNNDKIQLALQQANDIYQHLEKHLQQVADDTHHYRKELKYTNLASALLESTRNLQSKLLTLVCSNQVIPSVQLDISADEAHYDEFTETYESILDDMAEKGQKYKQVDDLFLSMNDDDEQKNRTTVTVEQQHQQLMIEWKTLQNEWTKIDCCYQLLTQQRPIYAVLYEVPAILDDIESEYDCERYDDDTTAQKLDLAKKLMDGTSSMVNQQQQKKQQIHHTTKPITDENEMEIALKNVFKQRHDDLLHRMETIKGKVDAQRTQHQYRESYELCQSMADEIKATAVREMTTLTTSYYILFSGQNQQIDSQTNSDTSMQFGTQGCQQCAKKVAESEQVLQRLMLDVEAMIIKSKSIDGMEDVVIQELESNCQQDLDKLKNQIQRNKVLVDLVRRVLGHNKSADNIITWLEHFQKAVQDLPYNNTTNSNDISHTNEKETSDLDIKLRGFEPLIGSLANMKQAIQATVLVDKDDDDDDDDHMASESYWKTLAQDRFNQVTRLWQDSVDSLERVKKQAGKSHQISLMVQKIRSMMSIVGNARDQIEQLQRNSSLAIIFRNTIETTTDNPSHQQKQPFGLDTFKSLPRDYDITYAEERLEVIENELAKQGKNQREEIDELVQQYHNDNDDDDGDGKAFVPQQKEMDAAWNNVMETINKTRRSLTSAKYIGKHICILDGIDVLLDSMDEVVLKAAPHYHATMVDNRYSKAELQAKLIELNARYSYYQTNIKQDLERAKESWDSLMMKSAADDQQEFKQTKKILEQYFLKQQKRWNELIEHQIPLRQQELQKAMEISLGNMEQKTRLRKSSLPTRKAASTLSSSTRQIPTTLSTQHIRPSSRTVASSSTSSTSGLHPSSALRDQQQHRLRTVTSSSALFSDSKKQSRQHELSSSSSSSTTTTTTTPLTFSVSSNKRTSTPLSTRKKPNAYVAQAGNALDMEIGRIINETPYRIKVKMVPGEVGRYWFGDVNPKLVYCRVLKSKMVMVRVGGGWTELSQFLRDHASLEGELIIPKKQNKQLLHTPIQEGYLETTTSLQRQRQQLMQQQQEEQTPSSIPTMKKSRSTPSNKKGIMQQKGYKEGDKFFAVDRHGNQLEVKMTKFSQQSALPVSTATNRRRKLVKG
ncbi:uncharacterized protein BX664DRAFT_352879 [Halteromyces radiatus]|uniref:uncharacterized protein n=1 Tax=Halteromyces radiatus TaxID=101107 RepID=UPI00221E9D43|nr:uncharacterized protein BX664DRAFT_352879 [Halteromyces radiatus]KAI8081780.1 hypothetical protein BX664DRAFT_352879 [Halteromyces radiatus]